MANPYKNTPLNQNSEGSLDKYIRLQQIDEMKKRISGELPYTYDGGKIQEKKLPANSSLVKFEPQVMGGGGALELLGGGGVVKAFQGGKKLFNIAKNLWNTGRKGGFGYANPVATGRNLNTIIQKKIGGKAVEFEKFGGFKVTPSDIKKAKDSTRPWGIVGTVGRTGVIGGAITGAWNYGDSGHSELEEAVVKKDQIYDPTNTYSDEINKLNKPFEMPKKDEKNK